MKDFIMSKITAVYYLCFKYKKDYHCKLQLNHEKEGKIANTFGIYYSLKI